MIIILEIIEREITETIIYSKESQNEHNVRKTTKQGKQTHTLKNQHSTHIKTTAN